MKTKVSIISFLLFSFSVLNAQTNGWIWGRYGGNGFGEATSVATDLNSNVISVGYTTWGEIYFGNDSVPSSNLNGIFIVKYDKNGNELWAKYADGNSSDEAWDVGTDKAGNIYMVGGFASSSIIFGNDTLYRQGYDSYITKYNPLGNVTWAKKLVCNGDDYSNSVVVDKNNNVYITGTFDSPSIKSGSFTANNPFPSTGQVYLAKLDPNGNSLWIKSFGGTLVETGLGLAVDKLNNVYVTGFFLSPKIIFGSDTLLNSNTSQEDVFLVKYDSQGNEIWAKSYGSTGSERAYGLACDSVGNTYMSGYFSSSSVAFGGYTLNHLSKGDLFLAKSSPNGSIIWAKSGQGLQFDNAWSVTVDTSMHVYVAGQFGYSPLDTLNFVSTNIYPPTGSLDPLFITKLDSSGNLLCSSALASGGVLTGGIASDRQGNVFLGAGGNVTPLIVGKDTMNGNLGPFIYTAKWNCDNFTGIPSLNYSSNSEISTFPNPTTNTLHIISKNIGLENSRIEISNSLGQIVLKLPYSNTIDVSKLTLGIYYLKTISSDQEIYHSKFVKE